jgi:hypothetical protein
MASLVLSVVYATDQRRNHRLYARHLHLSGVRAGVLGLQRVGDAGVNAVLLGQALAFATPGKSNVGGVQDNIDAMTKSFGFRAMLEIG